MILGRTSDAVLRTAEDVVQGGVLLSGYPASQVGPRLLNSFHAAIKNGCVRLDDIRDSNGEQMILVRRERTFNEEALAEWFHQVSEANVVGARFVADTQMFCDWADEIAAEIVAGRYVDGSINDDRLETYFERRLTMGDTSQNFFIEYQPLDKSMVRLKDHTDHGLVTVGVSSREGLSARFGNNSVIIPAGAVAFCGSGMSDLDSVESLHHKPIVKRGVRRLNISRFCNPSVELIKDKISELTTTRLNEQLPMRLDLAGSMGPSLVN